jgi:hypothetical protein
MSDLDGSDSVSLRAEEGEAVGDGMEERVRSCDELS